MDAYLVIDLEGTCSEDKSMPIEEAETIEVGAVVALSSGRTKGTFNRFVQPVLHRTLTEFCTKLTTITQADVDDAERFPSVLSQLMEFASLHRVYSFYSWGTYDRDQLMRDCQRHSIAYPFRGHTDLAKLFRKKIGRKRGSRSAMRHFGIEATGIRHRGMDDALNYSKMLPFLI